VRLLVLVVLVLEACASASSFELGKRSARAGNWDRAVSLYRKAQEEEPDNIEVRAALLRATLEASRVHLRFAREKRDEGDLSGAATELAIAVDYDPTNRYAREELEEIRGRLAEGEARVPTVEHERLFGREPVIEPGSSAPIHLKFAEETSLRTILEALARLAGVNILFDESFRDRQVTVDLDGVTFEQALELLLETNGLYYKVVDSTTLRLAPENPRPDGR
jgi:general secretion pathway protein D